MKRICAKIVQAEEILLVDSSGTMDALGCRVFVLLINSCAGGLPVAVISCSSEKEFVIQRALYMYKEKLLDEESFYGRGKRGPKIILTDDSDSERNSFAAAFPEAELLLCSFHVLQAIWRNLWKAEYQVQSNDRQELFYGFKKLLYSQNRVDFEENFSAFK